MCHPDQDSFGLLELSNGSQADNQADGRPMQETVLPCYVFFLHGLQEFCLPIGGAKLIHQLPRSWILGNAG